MGRPYQILLPLLSLFLVRVDLTDLISLKIPVKVEKIYDGDTVLVSRGSYQWRVRFVKIDSPEKGQPYLNGGGDAGKESTQCLSKILKSGSIEQLTIEKHDMYGRVLGDLNELTLKLIQNGCTTLYQYAQFDSRKQKTTYLLALKNAKTSKRGLWKRGGFRRPQLWRKTSKRNGLRP